MNKLVMDKNQQYIKGSVAAVPERQERGPIRKEDYELLRKSQIERSNRLKHNKNTRKRRVLKTIAVVFAFGFALMFNESKLYDRQQKITVINKEISEIGKSNEDMRIQLVKLNGLTSIKEAADNKLQMVIPERGKEIYVDFSKNNFAEVPREDKKSFAEEVVAKIKGLLF
ncbi:MAG: hypothetical protein Q8930_14540 [Bacillota bacterium]|nr:hypothetical protein [Bacillota bacterium]